MAKSKTKSASKTAAKKPTKTATKTAAAKPAGRAAKKAPATLGLPGGVPAGERIDVGLYARRLNIDVPSTIALVKRTLTVAPAGPPAVRTLVKTVEQAAALLTAVWKRDKPKGSVDLRPLDAAVDRSWSAVSARLGAWALIEHGNAARAAELDALLFPDGLSFTQLPWAAQWAEGDKRLTTLREKKLLGALAALVGQEFVDALEAKHREYGEALGLDGKAPVAGEGEAPASLTPPLQATLGALVDYAVQVVAAHNVEKDAKKRAALRKALAPIDAARAAAARGGKNGKADAPAEPDAQPSS
jgi:hypothetical protein